MAVLHCTAAVLHCLLASVQLHACSGNIACRCALAWIITKQWHQLWLLPATATFPTVTACHLAFHRSHLAQNGQSMSAALSRDDTLQVGWLLPFLRLKASKLIMYLGFSRSGTQSIHLHIDMQLAAAQGQGSCCCNPAFSPTAAGCYHKLYASLHYAQYQSMRLASQQKAHVHSAASLQLHTCTLDEVNVFHASYQAAKLTTRCVIYGGPPSVVAHG